MNDYGFLFPFSIVCIVLGMVIGMFLPHPHPHERNTIDKMIEVCHNNEGVEGFVSTNPHKITVTCRNGAEFRIEGK